MKLTAVLAGTPIPMPCIDHEGSATGFRRRPAPSDGFSTEEGGFVSLNDVDDAKAELKQLQARRPQRWRRR